MCGIAGFIGRGSRADLERMMDALEHRGPDDSGVYVDKEKGVYLGHRRLSIVDLKAPPQPMWDVQKKSCITYNGEVYNHLEIKKELESLGDPFSTETDTEVVLQGLNRWGEEALSRFNGMFAFAQYDPSKSNLLLARDRFGKKPLYYTLQKDTFIFSSELRSLLKHPLCPNSISAQSVQTYFAFNAIPEPDSILSEVYKLEAGHLLNLDVRNMTMDKKKWYSFIITPNTSLRMEEATEEFSRLFRASVKRRLMSDVPLGVFLSGGLDSSAVTEALSDEEVKPKCYSIGFNEKSFDESSYAKNVAEHLGFEHRLKVFDEADVEEIIPEALNALDEPMGDASIVPTYMLCKFARREVTVAIGGDGSDELLAGYDPFVALPFAQMASPFMGSAFRKLLLGAARCLPTRHENMTFEFRLRRFLRGFEYPSKTWSAAWMSSLDSSLSESIFPKGSALSDIFEKEVSRSDAGGEAAHLGERHISYYLKSYLTPSILCKVDRASMKNSLEVRAPFLDIDLVNFISTLPYHLRFKLLGLKTKRILRSHLRGRVSDEVLNRPKKGFGIPVAKWLLGPLRERMEAAVKPSVLESLGLNPEPVLRQWHEHKTFKEDHRAFLWNLLVLVNWKENCLDKR